MSRVLRWGDDSDSSDEEDVIRPSVVRSQLSNREKDDSSKSNALNLSNSRSTPYSSKNQSVQQRDRSFNQSTGDYRPSRSNIGNRGDSRQSGPSRNNPNLPPPPRRDWKEDARLSTLEKYSSVPSQADGSSWMEQRIQKQKQREKEELEKKAALDRQREEEKRRKKMGQIEALKAALISKTDNESKQQEIQILKPQREQEASKTVQQEPPSPPVSSLSKLAMETSVPLSRPKLKLERRTKSIPNLQVDDDENNNNNKPQQNPHNQNIEGMSSLAIAAKSHMKEKGGNRPRNEESQGKKSLLQDEHAVQQGDDQSRMSQASSDNGQKDRGQEAVLSGRRSVGGRGNKHKRAHTGRRSGRGNDDSRVEEPMAAKVKEEPSSHQNHNIISSDTIQHSSSKTNRKHKWETKPDGSVILSRVRQGSILSDKGSRDYGEGLGSGHVHVHGRGRGKQKGRGRGGRGVHTGL